MDALRSVHQKTGIILRNMIKQLLIAILLLVSLIPFMPPASSADYIIDGNKVYIDDINVYLSASPHTIGSSGWVSLELISKRYTGNIDIAFGFNQEIIKPTKIQIYRSYYHPLLYLETQNISTYDSTNSTWTNYTTGNWTWTNSTYEDWQDWNIPIIPLQYEYQGFNKWYISTNLPVTQGVLYKVRIYLDVPFSGLNASTGKYYFAVKPSSETIQQAISNGHFYNIDPWWNVAWKYRKLIKIDKTYVTNILSGFPVFVKLNSSAVANLSSPVGDDIRFVALDNVTEYPFEIENITSMGAAIWVNVSTIFTATDTIFWMYYNNSAATNGQNPTAVWDQYYSAGGVWHMNDSSLIWDSTINHHSQTSTNGGIGANVSGRTGNATSLSSQGYLFGDICDTGTNLFTIEGGWSCSVAFDASARRFVGKYEGPPGWAMCMQSQSDREVWGSIYDGAANLFMDLGINSGMDNGAWRYSWMNFTSSTTAVTVTDARWFKAASSGVMGNLNNAFSFNIGTWAGGGGYAFNGNIDEVRVSIGICRNESWMNATNSTNSNPNFLTFVSSEAQPTPSFTEIIYLGSPYPANNTNNTCPCGFTFYFNSTSSNGSAVNYTWYLRTKMKHVVDPLTFDQMNKSLGVAANSTAYFYLGDSCGIPAYSFHHTNDSIPADPVDTWRYVWFNETIDEPFANKNVNFSYPMNNYTWRILISGLYLIRYQMKFADSGLAPVSYATTRILINGLEAHGSIMRVNMDKKDSIALSSSQILKQLYVGDNITYQFQASHATVSLKSTSVAGDEPYSASVLLEKIGEPLQYNSTFYWYVNVSSYWNSSVYTVSDIYTFNTTLNESFGCGGVSSGTGSSDLIINDEFGFIGIIGIIGILGWLINRRRRT